jgi:hypothetical protein
MPLTGKASFFDDPLGPWAKFFAPKPTDVVPQFLVPNDWARFFTTLLLSPKHFSRVKELVQSKAFLSYISDGQNMGFSLPSKCPIKRPLVYILDVSKQEASDVNPLEAPPIEEDIASLKSKNKKRLVLVESEVRRSPRIKKSKNGFKDPVCKDKQCLGCNSKPPTLSSKMIIKLSSTLCDLDTSLVTDEALSKIKKNEAPSKNKKTKAPGMKKKKKKAPPMVDARPQIQ